MKFGPTKGCNIRNAIMYNVIWANLKIDLPVYHWLLAHASFDITCFPAFCCSIQCNFTHSVDTLIGIVSLNVLQRATTVRPPVCSTSS